jgi:hypothetical protein
MRSGITYAELVFWRHQYGATSRHQPAEQEHSEAAASRAQKWWVKVA